MAFEVKGNIRTITIANASDGDPSHRPGSSEWTRVEPPHPYLEKLGDAWMAHKGQRPSPNIRYYIDRLPAGYALFQRTRTTSKAIDKHLWGHPDGKYFDSPNRFAPHFLHLMDHGSNEGCPCTLCKRNGSRKGTKRQASGNTSDAGNSAIPAPITNVAAVRQILPGLIRTHDEEGMPDTVRWLFDRLKTEKRIDEPIREPLSMDWRAETDFLQQKLERLSAERAWVPRVAEVVLFSRKLHGELSYSPDTGSYRVWSNERSQWAGFPGWEAGVITQIAEERLDIKDLLLETQKSKSVTYSGFRVEPLADVNSVDKALASRSVYVPMHHIRPFAFHKEYLYGMLPQDIQESVWNARKAMSTVSVMGRYHFKGVWPNANLYCKGVYIGSELIVQGDVVRLFPRSDSTDYGPDEDQTRVLHVRKISVQFSGLDTASNNDYDNGAPYTTTIKIIGRAYTRCPRMAYVPNSPPTPKHELPPVMHGYHGWRLVHPTSQRWAVPFWLVAGKLYEADAMLLWHPGHPGYVTIVGDGQEYKTPALCIGFEGIKEAREYSTDNDQRIDAEKGQIFYWGDHRADALALTSFNNARISTYDETRDPAEWRDAVNIMEKVDGAEERRRQREIKAAMQEAAGISKVKGSGAMGLGVRDANEPICESSADEANLAATADDVSVSGADDTKTIRQPETHKSSSAVADDAISISSNEDIPASSSKVDNNKETKQPVTSLVRPPGIILPGESSSDELHRQSSGSSNVDRAGSLLAAFKRKAQPQPPSQAHSTSTSTSASQSHKQSPQIKPRDASSQKQARKRPHQSSSPPQNSKSTSQSHAHPYAVLHKRESSPIDLSRVDSLSLGRKTLSTSQPKQKPKLGRPFTTSTSTSTSSPGTGSARNGHENARAHAQRHTHKPRPETGAAIEGGRLSASNAVINLSEDDDDADADEDSANNHRDRDRKMKMKAKRSSVPLIVLDGPGSGSGAASTSNSSSGSNSGPDAKKIRTRY